MTLHTRSAHLAAFLHVALRDFAPGPRLVAAALYLFRFVGFVAFEAGWVPREALILFPNLIELWFLAVAFTNALSPGVRLVAPASRHRAPEPPDGSRPTKTRCRARGRRRRAARHA